MRLGWHESQVSSAGACQLVNVLKGSESPTCHPCTEHCAITSCTRRGEGVHALCTHSLKMLQTHIRSSNCLLKTKHAPSLATYWMRALQTTTEVLGRVGQIYQCITPLGTSSPGQGRGWLMNSCVKMASRSVRSPLIQTVLLVKLQIPLQGRSATKGACVFIS